MPEYDDDAEQFSVQHILSLPQQLPLDIYNYRRNKDGGI